MSELQNLITDRNSGDVSRVNSLNQKGWQSMTSEEQAEWLANMKGAYNASDLNRVGNAQALLLNMLSEYGYTAPVLSPKLDWEDSDVPTPAQMEEYIAITAAIRNALGDLEFTQIPSTMENLTYIGANQIEELLLQVEKYILAIPVSYIYSGEAFAGEF